MKLKQYVGAYVRKHLGSIGLGRMVEFPIVLDWLQPEQGEKICDVACGGGELSRKISKKNCTVYGIDLSECSIKSTNIFRNDRRARCEFMVGKAEALPFSNATFDKVVSNCSLEHFENDISALMEMNRVLKANGCLVLTVDSFSYPKLKRETLKRHKRIAYVVNYYTRESLQEKLEESGFRVVHSKYYLNSPISAFVSIQGIRLGYGVIYTMLSFIWYPLCLLSDRLFGKPGWGMCLAVKAEKIREV